METVLAHLAVKALPAIQPLTAELLDSSQQDRAQVSSYGGTSRRYQVLSSAVASVWGSPTPLTICTFIRFFSFFASRFFC